MPLPDRLSHGLRGHLNRFSHVVINVSDLDRAVEFYEKTFPVQRRQRINGPAQRYRSLGIEHGKFSGWVLENRQDASPPGALVAEFPARLLHLIQWETPKPCGIPYREANHVGIYRQNSLVDNLNDAYANVVAHGGRPYDEPSRIVLTPEGFAVTVFAYRDPDGSTLEMIGVDQPGRVTPYPGMMHHCNLNVRNLKRSYRFYRDVIGLDPQAYLTPSALQPVTNGSLGDCLRNPDGTIYATGGMRFAATLLGIRSDSRSPIDVLEWTTPMPYGEPYESQTNLGIVRVAFEVDNLEAARSRLLLAGHLAGAIETWDMGEFGERRIVIFKDPDGITLELIEALPPTGAQPPFD